MRTALQILFGLLFLITLSLSVWQLSEAVKADLMAGSLRATPTSISPAATATASCTVTPTISVTPSSTQTLTSTATQTPSGTPSPTPTFTLTAVPPTATPIPIQWYVDLHMHTTCSDGINSYEEMARAALNAGFDTIAITDHHFCRDVINACIAETRLVCIPGLEVTSIQHIVALGITEDIIARPDNASVVAEIHSRGALAIAAHPYLDPWRFDEADLMGIDWDGMECGIGNDPVQQYALETSHLHGIPCVYSSDAHATSAIGRRHMICSIEIHTIEDLRYALWNGLCQPVINYPGY